MRAKEHLISYGYHVVDYEEWSKTWPIKAAANQKASDIMFNDGNDYKKNNEGIELFLNKKYHDEEVAEKVRDFFDLGNNQKKNNVDKSFAYHLLRFEQETNFTMWMLAFCFLFFGPFTANIHFGTVQIIMWMSFIYSKVVNIFAKDKRIKTKWYEILLLVILLGKIIHNNTKVGLESKAKRLNIREKNQNRERIRLTVDVVNYQSIVVVFC